MRRSTCSKEVEISKAARTNAWDDALTLHLDECDNCKEIVQTAKWMQTLAQRSENTESLPDASLVWMRAQLLERHAKVERAQDFMDWMEIISAAVISAGLAGWIALNWYAIQFTITSVLAEPWSQLWTDAASAMSAGPGIFTLGAVILSVVAIALGFPMLVRD